MLGGTQALSRSFFSLLIPRGREGEYFALYNACERGTSWFGTLPVRRGLPGHRLLPAGDRRPGRVLRPRRRASCCASTRAAALDFCATVGRMVRSPTQDSDLPLFAFAAPKFLTISELNEIIKGTLEARLDSLWVQGEISNFRVPPSGHFYFCLKDHKSQISAVMFRRQGAALRLLRKMV